MSDHAATLLVALAGAFLAGFLIGQLSMHGDGGPAGPNGTPVPVTVADVSPGCVEDQIAVPVDAPNDWVCIALDDVANDATIGRIDDALTHHRRNN